MDTIVKNHKLIKVGNSYAVTVDPQFLKENNLEAGSMLTLRYANDGSFITLIPARAFAKVEKSSAMKKAEREAVLESKVTPEFRAWVEKSVKDDAQALKKLANL